MSTRLQAAPVSFVAAGDCSLAHRVVGDGPDVVFVHGWPLHGLTWRHITHHLAQEYRCHVFDLPGTGATRSPAELSHRVSHHARRVLAAIDTLGIERFALVGHNSGAAVSRFVAAEAGERVWANVVAGSEIPAVHPPMLEVMLRAARLPGFRTAFQAALSLRAVRMSGLGWGSCFVDLSCAEGEYHDLFGAPLTTDPTVLDGQLRLVRDWDWADTDALYDVHAKITGPTLLLWGDRDPWFKARLARQMVPSFPAGARFESRPDARLFVHEEHPSWFADRTRAFFSEVRAAEGG